MNQNTLEFMNSGGVRVRNIDGISALEFTNPEALGLVQSALSNVLYPDKIYLDYSDSKTGENIKSWQGGENLVRNKLRQHFS